MSTHLIARSIARPIQELLQPWTFNARVLATFDRVCNLATAAGDVLALVDAGVGDGPLNVVVEAAPAAGEPGPVNAGEVLAALKPGMPARIEEGVLRIGDQVAVLEGAVAWEPR